MNQDAIALHQEGVRLQQAGSLRDAAEMYRAALERDPRLELTRANLAMVYYQLGEVDQALNQYKTLLAAHPHNVKAYFNLGVIYGSIGRYDQAIQAYRQVLGLEAGHAMALHNMAWIFAQQKKYGEAIATYERLQELTPEDTKVLYQLGQMHRLAGDLERAEDYWKMVVALDARHVGGLLAMADVARMREDWKGVLKGALDALGVEPENPAARILAAKAHIALLEYGQAAEMLLSLAAEYPQMGEVRYQLGFLAHTLGNLPEARVHLAEAVRLDGHHSEYQNEYATVLYRLGELEEAAAHFREAEELAPDNAVIKANLGFCFMQMGDRETAGRYFEAFMARPAASETIRMSVQCAMDLL